jgi:hypothetical protein
MDFGFSPGGDAHRQNLLAMFGRRANTTAIASGSAVQEFIVRVNTSKSVKPPIGDLLIGTHATEEGQLSIAMFPGQGDWTKFETLETTLKDKKKSITIPDPLIGFTTGSAITHFVHLKGCNVGHAQPFLLKLKEALGGHVSITAPLFFHGATPTRQGVFEYVGYQFLIRRTDRYAKRKDALTDFDNAKFPLIDGKTTVPTADWESLIPPDANRERRQDVRSNLGVTLDKRTTVSTPRQYRVTRLPFGPWRVPFPNAAAVPTNAAAQLQELENHMGTFPVFQSSHPFPQYTREGFADLHDFISGYKWDCRPTGASLICNGVRFEFEVVLAITDPATTPPKRPFYEGNIIFNFYPAAGSKLTAITNALDVTDATFFATV